MEPLPEDVAAAVARGLGAYLRATPSQELPASLRRFQQFRPKTLGSQRDQLLGALEDAGLRARVLEWLDDKPTLPKNEAEVLRLAVARPEGWGRDLQAKAKVREPKAVAAVADPDAIEREKERLRKAKEEVRRAREEAQREIESLQRETARLDKELQNRLGRIGDLQKKLEEARSKTEKARVELDRERRKSRAASERAAAAGESAKKELRTVRRELHQREREIAKLMERIERLGAARPKKPKPPAERRTLPVPKGRFEDDPETLANWLEEADVELLIDGYNASMSAAGFGNLALEDQRQRLIDEVGQLARRFDVPATIVFDGSDVVPSGKRARGPVKVQYSKPGEIADDYLIALLKKMPPHPVVVVTSDKELQDRAHELDATIATSEQLHGLLR